MIATIILLACIIALFAGVIFMHSAAAEREQQELAASYARAAAERRSYAAVKWPETEPMCFHRAAR